MNLDFVMNGQGHGDVATILMNAGFDHNVLRPWMGDDGRMYRNVVRNGKVEVIVTNTPATLRKDDWKILDEAIVKAAKPRLRAWADIRGAGLSFSIPNGMGKTVLETERQSDIGPAIISMDGVREGDNDRPLFDLTNLPLPIIHKDFSFTARQIAASRSGGSPLDTTSAELAARRVAEEVEKLTIGVADTYAYGGGTIYGLKNFPSRNTHTLTSPTSGGWTPATLVGQVLAMKAKSQADFHYGPWMLYCSPSWDAYMDDDYSAAKGDLTLRERLKKIDGIQDCRTLDYLENYDLLLVQMTNDVVRAVSGMEMTTVQWESKGGLQLHYKVMCIWVPQVRADYNGNCGIVHGATA